MDVSGAHRALEGMMMSTSYQLKRRVRKSIKNRGATYNGKTPMPWWDWYRSKPTDKKEG